VDQEPVAAALQDPEGLLRVDAAVIGQPGVEGGGLTLPQDLSRRRSFLNGGLGVRPVRVENIDIVPPHAPQRLIQTGDQYLREPPSP